MEAFSPEEPASVIIEGYSDEFEDPIEWFLDQADKIAGRFFSPKQHETVLVTIDEFFGNDEKGKNLSDFFIELAHLLAFIQTRRGKITLQDLYAAMSFVDISSASIDAEYQSTFLENDPREDSMFREKLQRIQQRARRHLETILNSGSVATHVIH